MSNFIAASSGSIAPRATLARLAVVASSVFGLLLSLPRGAAAQTIDPSSPRWELRFSSGALVGTGNQRTAIKDANFSAAQLSWLVRPSVAVTGTFGWARSRDLQSAKLDVFTSDLGVELRPARLALNGALSFAPFIGAGAGARSYNYRSQNVDATNNLAG